MDKNEKIVAAVTAAVVVGSAALFAIAKIRKNHAEKPQNDSTITHLPVETTN